MKGTVSRKVQEMENTNIMKCDRKMQWMFQFKNFIKDMLPLIPLQIFPLTLNTEIQKGDLESLIRNHLC